MGHPAKACPCEKHSDHQETEVRQRRDGERKRNISGEKVFISYRRSDKGGAYAGQRLFERLIEQLGEGSVVFDVETIPYGDAVARCTSAGSHRGYS